MTAFPDLLTARLAASPDAPLLEYEGAEWTAAELDAEVDAVAGHLAARDVGPGDRVAVLMETRPAFVRLVFALHRLGAVLVPLNARLAPAELAAQCETVAPSLVVCEAETADAAREATEAPLVSVDGRDATALDADGADFDPATWTLDEDAALMFTSGTTGTPKAVRLTVGNVLASAVASAVRLGVDPDDRWLCPLSLYHMGGLAVVLRSALYGTTAVIQRGFDAGRARRALDGCTGVSLVPTMCRRMLDDGPFPDSLRFVLVGGAPAPAALIERCADRGVPVCPTYGMTETASQVATARPAEAYADPDTVGRPMLGTQVTVVDEGGDPVPAGETGELVVDGATVTPGYVGAEAPFCASGLRTGDVGRRDDAGRLHVLNRRSDRIVTGGENVDPGGVAATLREHPDVRDAAVVGLPDPEWGERVAALVVPRDSALDAAALRAFCADRLADFEVPKTVAFADSLPRTASGTVDRGAVRERLREADD
ncbi:MAG: class I adenylate-forming enzyme family protein [Halobacteriaceae archaeon]